jgi:hypothetical protein
VFGRIKVNENWSYRYKKELMQPFGVIHVLSFFRINVNGMDSKIK